MKAIAQLLVHALRAIATTTWRVAGVLVISVGQVAAALIVLFEEWGWRPLSLALARLQRYRLWARLELALAGLPPYAALAAIALPTTLLFPLKFVAIWLVANGHVVAAAALFVAAKIASTALIARIFILVRPALMQIGWLAALYDRFVPWKEALFAEIRATWIWRYGRMLKSAVRHEAMQSWSRWRPTVHAWLASARAGLAQAWLWLQPRLQLEWLRLRLMARRAWARIAG